VTGQTPPDVFRTGQCAYVRVHATSLAMLREYLYLLIAPWKLAGAACVASIDRRVARLTSLGVPPRAIDFLPPKRDAIGP